MHSKRFIATEAAGERGVALITTMLLMILMSALLVGFSAVVVSDQKYRLVDRDRARAFYGAQSGLEKLTADFANLFFVSVAPTDQQIAAIGEEEDEPVIADVTFMTAGTGDAYGVTAIPAESVSGPISTGPYQGLIALKRVYWLDSSVKTTAGGEAHVRRKMESVAIPVFQFGMFSDVDLSFSAADTFDFGGRVHTNGNLYLAQGGGSSSILWLRDKVTAVREIVRQRLSNGVSIDVSGSTRTVRMATAPGAHRDLARTEGSVDQGPTSTPNPSWPTLSLSDYNGYIRDGTTGAKALNLPLLTSGGTNNDLVRRPAVNENNTNPTLLGERYFSKVSLRILLSDVAADITNLPGATVSAPVSLDGNWVIAPPNNGAPYGPVDATHPPIARSEGLVTTSVTGGAIATGTNQNIRVTAMPVYFQLPATLSVTSGGITYTVACTTKTETRFDGCGAPNPVPGVAIGAGAVVTAVVATADTNVNVSTTSTATWNWGLGRIDVVSTLAFAPNTFWVDGTNQLVTCRGYDATPRFVGCNVPTAIPNNSVLTTAARSNQGTGTIGGFLKIERQNVGGTWTDVTMEILNWGMAGPNLNTDAAGNVCPDPTPNAIIRLQRLRDNGETAAGACSYPASQRSTDYWPNVLFDSREAIFRDVAPASLRLGGVMHYVALDVSNLSRWFAGTGVYAAGTGTSALSNGGFSVYFSDRRNNRNGLNQETGEYGFEDVVNPATGGVPDAMLDAGEDMNGNTTLETYGQFPSYNGVANSAPPGAGTPLDTAARPTTALAGADAKVNRSILFRRALKLINGGLGNIVAPGFTVASENPVYLHGDWNAAQTGFSDTDGHVATSIVCDAITVLSNAWNDNNSFSSPYATAGRPRASQTFYRVAIIAGKGPIFPQPNGTGATFGTDGGAHSFLRFLEGNGANPDAINYRGAMATFYYHRQAVSPFKCCGGAADHVPTRNYAFDVDFLDPARLPPLTPVFRDLNALGFTQETRPGQ